MEKQIQFAGRAKNHQPAEIMHALGQAVRLMGNYCFNLFQGGMQLKQDSDYAQKR